MLQLCLHAFCIIKFLSFRFKLSNDMSSDSCQPHAHRSLCCSCSISFLHSRTFNWLNLEHPTAFRSFLCTISSKVFCDLPRLQSRVLLCLIIVALKHSSLSVVGGYDHHVIFRLRVVLTTKRRTIQVISIQIVLVTLHDG